MDENGRTILGSGLAGAALVGAISSSGFEFLSDPMSGIDGSGKSNPAKGAASSIANSNRNDGQPHAHSRERNRRLRRANKNQEKEQEKS